MQSTVIFALIVAVIYILASLGINRFSEEKKTLKTITKEACIAFLSVIATHFIVDTLGLGGSSQKGGSITAAFTSKPDF